MVHGVKTVNCAIKYDTRLQLNVKFRCHVWDGTPCRDKAVSLSLGLRYITNSICPILHAYLLQGYSVKAGHPPLLRSLVQIVTPSCWNVIIWWSLISFCKASQWNGMNILQEIWKPRLRHSTPFKGALQWSGLWLCLIITESLGVPTLIPKPKNL